MDLTTALIQHWHMIVDMIQTDVQITTLELSSSK